MGKMQPVWIDVICIDQQSVSKRNHQVRVMGSIYRRAISVIAWLGPIDSDMQSLCNICTIVRAAAGQDLKQSATQDLVQATLYLAGIMKQLQNHLPSF